MSLSLHAGHCAHSFVKAFVAGSRCRSGNTAAAKERFPLPPAPNVNQDSGMPSRRMRLKREPLAVAADHDELFESHVTSTTTKMPVRAASVMSSTALPANGDVDMAESNGNGTINEPATVGMQALGGQSRQLIQAIQTLESLNIDATLPSLPKFVVIGDQSAGKSSIIEAISDITLPRSAGTCTRCPFKITTTSAKNDAPWVCRVSLHVKYAFTGSTRPSGPFVGWVEQKDLMTLAFATVHDKSQLELTLRQAQLAILNPDKNPAHYLHRTVTSDDNDEQRVLFSPNVISLDISAPGLPELSFYDLPGAINTVSDESQQHLVDFVEALIMSYIQEEKTLILLACAANQDLETSTAFRFLRKCRAKERAVGVLTKPDLMEQNRASFVDSLLSNKTYQLGGGWYVTRQLSQKQLDQRLTYEDARRIEADFFSDPEEMWTRQLAAHAPRFGVSKLQTALSQRLVKHILEDLPEIMGRVQARLSYVNDQLAMFPEQVTAPSLSVIMEIDKVRNALVQQLNADSLRSTMRKDYRDVFRNFFKKLQDLKPKVSMATPGYQRASITVESSEEESPSKSRRTNSGRAMSVVASSGSNRARRTPATNSSSSQGADGVTYTVFRLNDVKRMFDAAPGADLPAQASESVVRDLISETLVAWGPVTEGALKKVKHVFIQSLNETVSSALAQRQTTELFNEVERITHALFEELFQGVEDTVHKLIAGEIHRPMTYNDTLKQKKAFFKTEYRKARQEKRVAEYSETLEAETGKIIPVPEQKKKAADSAWVTANLGPDEYDREVEALATPTAYYEIASASLVDSIAKQFETGLMDAYETRIHRKLLEDLQTSDQAHCAQLLAEDPERERQRAELVGEQSKLEQALAELDRLPASHLPD